MEKYEYRTKTVATTGWMGGKIDDRQIDTMLNDMGENGWELVSTVASNTANFGATLLIAFFFKRRKNG